MTIFLGALLVSALVYIFWREGRFRKLLIENAELRTYSTEQRRAAEEKLELLTSTEKKLTETFKALSSEALEKSNQSFLSLAKENLDKKHQSFEEIVKPVRDSLKNLDKGMQDLEKERKGEQEVLKSQMKAMIDAEKGLRDETSSLVKALRKPLVRGQWGEMQLRRVVEVAGMLNHCDFFEQVTADAGAMRPDMIIRLPGDKQVIVDAKTPCEAYLDAIEASDDTIKENKLRDHARQVRQHITQLGKKGYWQKFQPTPEFVVLFIPSDAFYSAALEYDPSLIEVGVEQGVIIATPSTLIGLLRAIAYGWKQDKLSQHAEQVSELGHELYKRIVDMRAHWSKMGRALNTAVESYNGAVGSLESRVLVSARKFKEFGAAARGIELDPIRSVDRVTREVQAVEMKE